jgi:[acyl-carrier-protein] S-malonyltransferase
MQQAGAERPGTMAAVIGLEPETVDELCRTARSEGVVQAANYNSPGQIVLSGSVGGVRKAMELAKQRGAKMVKELSVSGAFHSPLMESAQERLRKALDQTDVRDAAIPVYANVTAEPVFRAEQIRELLAQQVTSAVRWQETIVHMIRDGAREFIEVGPGKVLQGLIKRIDGSVTIKGIEKLADLGV